jgi:eukaryotic-like serine/threonine-protein kinase
MGESAAKSSSFLAAAPSGEPETFGRYVLHAPIARGGMATIHLARLIGAEGFSRIVAAKRLHPQFTEDPDFVSMFHEEARIASKIHHPNVVPVLDVVLSGTEVILVQEYVHGVPLDRLFKAALVEGTPAPIGVVVAIVAGVLSGLHAAHETKDETDEPLNIVHRDVSPQNVMVSMDGVPRLLDFGIAKAASSVYETRAGLLKGKLAYMPPEQLGGEGVTRTADVYSTGVLLWELIVHRRLHEGRGEMDIIKAVMDGSAETLTGALKGVRASIPKERWAQIVALEPVVAKAVASASADRFATAADMLEALVRAGHAATPMEVAQWVKLLGAEYLERRQQVIASNEESWRSHSRITAAAVTGEAPAESGLQRTAPKVAPPRSDGLSAASRAAASFIEAANREPTSHTGINGADPWPQLRQSRFVPWIIAAVLLLFSGILLGVLGERKPPVVEASAPPIVETPAVTATTVVTRPEPPPAPIIVPVVAAVKPTRPIAPAQVRWIPPPKAPTVAASIAPSSTPPAPKLDCSPPFYFEGSKKLFKPGCL